MSNSISTIPHIKTKVNSELIETDLNVSIKNIDHPLFDKYTYIIHRTGLFKAAYIYAILSWILVLSGFYGLIIQDLWYSIILLPILIFQTIYLFTSYAIVLLYPKIDLKNHLQLVEEFVDIEPQFKPNVDILLPICGEDVDIIERTWRHILNLNYPNYTVHVLDDNKTANPYLISLASQLKFNYLSRPNKGEMKKAGNLKFGFENTSSEFITIFDADFAPHPEFMNETVPYLFVDDKIGILQTPQYFENSIELNYRNTLEYGAGCIQEDFYKFIQPSRDVLGGAICVGSNAVYRREALAKVGGTAYVEHSEDVWTGVKILSGGYLVRYIPVILAQGTCPDNLNAFFKQQYRWCKGSMSLMVSKFFWQINVPWTTKLCYITGFAYYLQCILMYVMPILTLVVLYFNFDRVKLEYALPYLPILVFNYVFLNLIRSYRPTFGVLVAKTVAISTYCLAVFHVMFNKNMNWVPTGAIDKKIKDYWYEFLYKINLMYFGIFLGICVWLYSVNRLPLNNIQYYSMYFWIAMTLTTLGSMLAFMTLEKIKINQN